ncbi:hypothetical protein SAMN05518801_104257 [Novosphingobium sp. CF614]|uniref:hypothetical protein n=1 Tax=Novosphingobium sp. CF614 TaxID=1884364 RepID=UPI0008E05CB8|nr:hypothetical protein [Novosphingobium sp. CF614]SFF97178.1 hypothetical protein SAMN05518801_104257 [Novosphingobium sp. CF614]
MAYDDADIGRPKAAIPKNFQPPPESRGRLTNDFLSVDSLRESTPLQGSETAVAMVDYRAADDSRERHNLGMNFLADAADNPDAANPGFLLPGALANAHAARVAQSEQRQRDDDRRFIISQIEARNRQIAENLKRLEILDKQETALQDHLARLRRGEKAELDEDGKLENKDAEAAVREYEERYGVTVNRNDAAQIAVILQGVRDQKILIRRDNERLAAENEQDRQSAIRMGADPASIPATVKALETTDAGRRSLNNATAKIESAEVRIAAVEARAFDETTKARAVSAATIQNPDDGFAASVAVPVAISAVSAASKSDPTNLGQAPDAGKAFETVAMRAATVSATRSPEPLPGEKPPVAKA